MIINNRYIIEKKLGEGRSKVYLCRDIESGGNKLTIKILSENHSGNAELLSFREEYYTLQRLNHPNIIKVHDLGTVIKSDSEDIQYGSQFFTMDYFPGKTFDEYKFDINNFNHIITQICSVLFYLHQANYVYYDLKPENILITIEEIPQLRFIDFGLAEHLPDQENFIPKGTAQYIAPEILKKQPHDFRVDLYSLGILLYKLVYGKFPFNTDDELHIYKAHLESEFDFPDEFDYPKLTDVIKKALAKLPEDRYDSALKILIDLGIPISEVMNKDFLPAKVFTNRRDVLSILRKYISDDSSHEVFSLRGYESMGKTFLTEELEKIHDEVILITESHTNTGMEFIRILIKRIFYHLPSHRRLKTHILPVIDEFIHSKIQLSLEEIKKIFLNIIDDVDFILVMDGYNLYDETSLELLRELIPILQIKKKKIILTEESEFPYMSDQLSNLQEINISPFTEANLTEYMGKNFYPHYPLAEVSKLVLRYADLLPGSIESFLKDIHLFGIIKYDTGYPVLELNDNSIQLLKSSHDDIYNARLKILDETELKVIQILSLFEFPVNLEILKHFFPDIVKEESDILSSLEKKNILQNNQLYSEPLFSSSGLKKYIYSTISDAGELHGNIAFRLKDLNAAISRTELARQFELAKLYDESYKLIIAEVDDAEKQSAHSYQRQLLNRLINLPLSSKQLNNLKIRLCKVLSDLNDYKNILSLMEEIEFSSVSEIEQQRLVVIKAKSLAATGELLEARDLLYKYLEMVKDESIKNIMSLEIAYIEYDLSNVEKSKLLCNSIIENEKADLELKGSAYNLSGLISYSHDDKIEEALQNFKDASNMYEKAGQAFNQLKTEINIGNILFLRGDVKSGVDYWHKAQNTNSAVGNLEKEALITMNLGAYDFSIGNYEAAENHYDKARSVFISIGHNVNYCSVLLNLSEIYLETCRYDEMNKCLLECKRTLYLSENYELEADTYFIQGKYYYYLGDYEKLKEVINEYQIVIKKDVLPDKYYNSLNSLIKLYEIETGLKQDPGDFEKIIQNFVKIDDKYNFVKFYFIYIEYLIGLQEFENALKMVNDDMLITCCKDNPLHETERVFLTYMISTKSSNAQTEQISFYLNDVLQKIENLVITELTWKVLFTAAEYFKIRGNETKFKEYFDYAKSVLNYIVQGMSDSKSRSNFINNPKRKIVFDQINK